MGINVKAEVESILERKLTPAEFAEWRLAWTHAVMNPYDLAALIKAAA